jgi:hypothetical protein
VRLPRIVFTIAGVYGLLALTPMYFTFDAVGWQTPPAITHAEFYYGFVGLAMVWQVVFLMIASDPARFRPMMIASVLEKASWFISVLALYGQHRTGMRMLSAASVDAILGVLFVVRFPQDTPGFA